MYHPYLGSAALETKFRNEMKLPTIYLLYILNSLQKRGTWIADSDFAPVSIQAMQCLDVIWALGIRYTALVKSP